MWRFLIFLHMADVEKSHMPLVSKKTGNMWEIFPSALEISIDPRDFPRASPSGNLSRHQLWISQYIEASYWWSTELSQPRFNFVLWTKNLELAVDFRFAGICRRLSARAGDQQLKRPLFIVPFFLTNHFEFFRFFLQKYFQPSITDF